MSQNIDVRDMEVSRADERELMSLMKAWRGGRATRNLLEAISSAYVMIFTLTIITAMFINVLINTQKSASTCAAAGCRSARAILPLALALALIAGAAFLSRLFGPVLASAAEGFWLLDAPINRRRILFGRLVRATVTAFIIGAVLGFLVSTLTGSSWLSVVAWALACGLGAASMVTVAATQQGRDRVLIVKAAQIVFTLLAVAALGSVIAISTGLISLGEFDRGQLIAVALAGMSLVVLIATWILSVKRLNNIRRARLMSGGSLVAGMQGAMFGLDLGLMRDILVERHYAEKGNVTPTKGKGRGWSALVWRDLERLKRNPAPIFALVLSMVIPYALTSLGIGMMMPFISAWVLCFILVPFFQQLRVLSRTKGLIRMFPFSTQTIRNACMVMPGVMALLWAVAICPAFFGVAGGKSYPPLVAVYYAFVTAFAALMGAVRWTSARSVNFNTPMFSTAAGALPPGLLGNLFRGTDMVALITLPIILLSSRWWWVSAVIAFIVWSTLSQSSSMDELQEQAKEVKRENERLKEEERKRREELRLKRGK
ncbi:MAG: DUF6297 family protein [Propionibacteriaceae bacterium]